MMASFVSDHKTQTKVISQGPLHNGSSIKSSMAFANEHSKGQLNKMGMDPEEEGLEFDNREHPSDLLLAMGNLCRQNQFCDAVLRVGEREVNVHRAVLAASSPFLFELFERSAETHRNNIHHTASMYKLKDVTFAGFSYLLDYMYSGRLSVGAQDVGEVYRTAKLLRMEQATQACSAFLVDRLTPSNCLGIRGFAQDVNLIGQIDQFIQQNVEAVINSKYFFGLPELKVEIIGAENAVENGGSVSELFNLVLDWARGNVDKTKPKVDLLTEELNVLYLNADNHLQDCKDVDDSRMSDDDVVVDYKKHSRRRSTLKDKHLGASEQQEPVNTNGHGNPMPFHVFNISPEGGVAEKEWSVIATMKQKGSSYMGLAVLSGQMMAISLHLRQVASPVASIPQGVVTPNAEDGERCASLQPLDVMSFSRCAFGVCVWKDKLVVCGGYDRGECLVSVEVYNPAKGRWSKLPSMLSPRARFGAASLNDCLYAIGGSDGTRDLDSVHFLNFESKKWEVAANLKTARSSVGVAELGGRLYCVGGSDGQRSLKTCEVYVHSTNQWQFIAPLNTARFQASVSAYDGCVLAVGGTDSWNCLNSVEMYQPAINSWTLINSLSTIRRGAGIDVVGNNLWVIGGSDGVSSLRSTEVYDSETGCWSAGPTLNVPRANVSAISLNGNLYAIGGFSGKKFLNSLEVLAQDSQEWCSCQPARRPKKNSLAESSGDEQQTNASDSNDVHTDSDAFASDQDNNSADEAR